METLVREGVPVVRRPTGGQAVWHEHEVTYAVAAPIALFGSLRGAYREIHGRLAIALRTLGVEAVLANAPAVRPSGRPVWRRWPPSEMLSAMPRRAPFQVLVILAVVTLAGCERRGGCTGAYCGTLINAAVAE